VDTQTRKFSNQQRVSQGSDGDVVMPDAVAVKNIGTGYLASLHFSELCFVHLQQQCGDG
jgi:hypothetical protein